MNDLLLELAADPYNPEINFRLGLEYDSIRQVAAAISYYLRAAEYGHEIDNELVYTALLKVARCLESQREREYTVSGALLQAVALLPERKEAYLFLSQYYERHQKWWESYAFAEIGLALEEHDPLKYDVGFYGEYCLDFQKAVAAWWIGRREETIIRLTVMKDMNIAPEYKAAVINNIKQLKLEIAPDPFELAERVSNIKKALKLRKPIGVAFNRFGSEHDGGYILVDDISDQDHLISFGVDKNIDFEKDMVARGCQVDAYDYSVDGFPEHLNGASFFKEKIGLAENGDTSLFQCIHNVTVFTDDLILKMDIEGGELDVLASTDSEDLAKFRQITVEFHEMNKLEDKAFYNKLLKGLTNLAKTHYPVLVHPNNDMPLLVIGNSPVPTVFEVLFLRKDSYEFEPEDNPLDGLTTRNNIYVPEMGLSFP